MSSEPTDRKARRLLALLIALGCGLLAIPWFLTPPAFGRLEVAAVDAAREAPIAARIADGDRLLSDGRQGVVTLDLPAGRHRLAASAAGYCPGDREIEVPEGKLVRARLPLSPDLRAGEIARIVLGWEENPRDLDAHLRKLGTTGFPNPAHVFFQHKEGEDGGRTFARLDVDQQHAEGYETITLLDGAEGDYEYFVHLYAGEGTLGGSHATVDLITRGCRRRRYLVPAGCGEAIWSVAHLHVHQGQVSWSDQQRCEHGVPLDLTGKVATPA